MDEFDEFSLITRLDQQKLTHLLLTIPGAKEIVVEANLIRPLDKILSMTTLRSQNCLRVQQLHIDKAIVWDEATEQRTFFIRPTIALARKICELIRSDPGCHYSVIQVDRPMNLFYREFERNGLHGMVNFYEFNLTLVHLESDLFSLELPQHPPSKFSHYFEPMAKTLWQLETLYGQIQTIFSIGACSQAFDKQLRLICNELGEPSASADQPISHLFLFDRRMDLASVLLTGLTYESILKDAFVYECGKITFGSSIDKKLSQRQNPPNATSNSNVLNDTTTAATSTRAKSYALNNGDAIFSSIRNSHMTEVFPFLKAKSKLLHASFDRISSIHKVDEMKHFVSNELGTLREQQKQLEIHICACEHLLETMKGFNEKFQFEHSIIRGEYEDSEVFGYLQKMVACRSNPWHILQLASLWCLRANGISAKYYRQFQKNFLHRYGFERIADFYELRVHGMLFEAESGGALNRIFPPPLTSSLKIGQKSLMINRRSSQQSTKGNFEQNSVQSSSRSPSSNLCAILSGFRLCPQPKQLSPQLQGSRGKQENSPEHSTTSPRSEGGRSTTTGGYSEESDNNKNNIGFVFSDAYIPLISYLVDRTVTKGWEEAQFKKVFGEQNIHCSNPQAKAPDNRIRRALLICFIGGVTFAEIASLRCFAQNRDFRLIILTTQIINREEFLKNFTL